MHRISAAERRIFGEAAPRGEFGVWLFFPPIPAIAGNTSR